MDRISAVLPSSSSGEATLARLRHFERIATLLLSFGAARKDPVQRILAHVGNFWSNAIVCTLQAGPLRPSALQKILSILTAENPISGRMLTLNLRSLEEDDLIEREVYDTRNPHVEYRLTPLGDKLSDMIFAIVALSVDHYQGILEARNSYKPPKASKPQRGRR